MNQIVTKTIWLLDFDGVINVNKPKWSAAPHQAIAYANNTSYKLRWAPALIEKIREISRLDVSILWASTWCGHTGQLERILKLPALLSAAPTAMSYRMKCEAAEAAIARGCRLIWTDDEVVPTWGALYDRLTKNDQALLIKPKSNTGLTSQHIASIESFIKGS